MSSQFLQRPFPLAALVVLTCLMACTGGEAPAPEGEAESPGSVTVYSGRNESLLQPILDRFTETTGIAVKVRYGGTAELAATLMEEGPGTPAEIFISQDAAALAALTGAGGEGGMLLSLMPATLDRVAPRFRDPEGRWIGLSGRARVVVYNTELTSEEALPKSLEAVADPRYKGTFGVAPTNASLQAHLAAFRVLAGAEALDALLAGIAGNDPEIYPKNSAIVEAVAAGEVEWGLVNHYYLWNYRKEHPEAPADNFTMTEGPAAGFVNMAAAGILRDTPQSRALVDFLLGEEAQRYFAEQTFEYPLAAGVEAAAALPPLTQFGSLEALEVDFAAAAAQLEETLTAIRSSGLLP
jgi:iron(III) transport system substrate-binding protein